MAGREVNDVNVVLRPGAIGGRIIIAEDGKLDTRKNSGVFRDIMIHGWGNHYGVLPWIQSRFSAFMTIWNS